MLKVGPNKKGVCMPEPPFVSLPITWLATNGLCSNLACQLSAPTACFARVEDNLAELKNRPHLNRSQGLCGHPRGKSLMRPPTEGIGDNGSLHTD